MKFSGELTVQAPRAQVYDKVRDARFFASCVDGVSELAETARDTYAAMFETKVAYMKFKFKVTVQVTRAEPPREIEAKVEGTPLGIVGRLTASAMRAVFSAQDRFGLLLSVGLVTMLAFHMIVNIGMTIGIMPVTGIPLPFMSYGGSALITNFLAVGILINVALQKDRLIFGDARARVETA